MSGTHFESKWSNSVGLQFVSVKATLMLFFTGKRLVHLIMLAVETGAILDVPCCYCPSWPVIWWHPTRSPPLGLFLRITRLAFWWEAFFSIVFLSCSRFAALCVTVWALYMFYWAVNWPNRFKGSKDGEPYIGGRRGVEEMRQLREMHDVML